MKQILVITFFILSFQSFAQNCAMLKDGKYKMQYDSQTPNSSVFEVSGNTLFTYENEQKIDSAIIKLGLCSFMTKPKDKIDESKLTELQKLLSKQQSYFEITKVEGNTYFFICRIDLHIQCGT